MIDNWGQLNLTWPGNPIKYNVNYDYVIDVVNDNDDNDVNVGDDVVDSDDYGNDDYDYDYNYKYNTYC